MPRPTMESTVRPAQRRKLSGRPSALNRAEPARVKMLKLVTRPVMIKVGRRSR